MALADYLDSYLGGLASQLGFTVLGGSYEFIVSEALLAYGVDTEILATNKNKLYSLAKVKLWEAILREISFDYDISADSSSNKRSQMYDMAAKNLSRCMTEALIYMPGYQIEIGTIETEQNPYQDYPPYYQRMV